jgi:hypothetical protein
VSTGYSPEIVSNKVAKELLAGRMAGPFLDPLPSTHFLENYFSEVNIKNDQNHF